MMELGWWKAFFPAKMPAPKIPPAIASASAALTMLLFFMLYLPILKYGIRACSVSLESDRQERLFYPMRGAQPAPLLAQHDGVGRIAGIVLQGRGADRAPQIRGQYRLQIREVLAGGVLYSRDGVRVEDQVIAKFEQVGIAHFSARMEVLTPAALEFG